MFSSCGGFICKHRLGAKLCERLFGATEETTEHSVVIGAEAGGGNRGWRWIMDQPPGGGRHRASPKAGVFDVGMGAERLEMRVGQEFGWFQHHAGSNAGTLEHQLHVVRGPDGAPFGEDRF
jgi:hypothetical protein